MKTHVYNTLAKLKQHPVRAVTIKTKHNDIPFRLVLITKETVNDPNVVFLLAKWRKGVLRFIPSTSPITVKGTKEWLQTRVIDEKDRVLFLVVVDDKPIGHVGLYRYNPKDNSIVIDNVIRGVAGYPGVMGEAILALIHWAKKTLHIKTFLVDCSSNNDRAIALYNRIGFREIGREPLVQVKTKGGYVFADAPKKYTGPIDYYRVVFRRDENQ